MVEKRRITRISTRFLVLFKVVALAAYTAMACGLAWFLVVRYDDWYFILNAVLYLYWLYRLVKVLLRMYYVEFDADFLYVRRRGSQEVMIPLENIKDVDIRSIGGVYRVALLYDDVVGRTFYFKPSLLYPLNYRAKDERVFLLREYIARAKRRRQIIPANALTS